MSRRGRCRGLHCAGCGSWRGAKALAATVAALAIVTSAGSATVDVVMVAVALTGGLAVLATVVVAVVLVRRRRRARSLWTPYAITVTRPGVTLGAADPAEVTGRVVRELPGADDPARQSADPGTHAGTWGDPRYARRDPRIWGDRP
jgi:hypothetical protein